MTRHRFLVVVDAEGEFKPCIGDVFWALKDPLERDPTWSVHVTDQLDWEGGVPIRATTD